MSVVVTARIEEHINSRVDSLAAATGRSKSWIASEAIRRYVELESWQVAEIQQAIKEADAGDFATDEKVAATFKRLKRNAR